MNLNMNEVLEDWMYRIQVEKLDNDIPLNIWEKILVYFVVYTEPRH
jgi:hypothetical protein